ncbi:50S ribosomal protein L25/general stress protein Ctc [Lederbergia galactosidilytica]|uniref:Large ribosomal subunit protein bL25 n=1 Tax=Lederbergia galactosidilytica TaxID=217031 RepID=A0A0Q9XXS4_9BACI|nr:50S ribosomal protein L25/general stress protein Ctc [Lederbergia galactosidilytica]KRG12846.1 50S ribosomal protein L25 [Virgibacillus soli]KRG13580.1 50S ribosomal protein L25 [Lederbergia galactosidilytica]MBP1916855.1 large subunit ribosomal protein L25 [Lederbergia galactosidilytica]OAK72058.1 50S ribosomal protein L25 [Lederbergia galactosidilytica]
MESVLTANRREHGRRSQLTEIRERGDIPAVLYGYQVENTPIFVNSIEFVKTMREVGRNGVISLDLGGNKVNVILHEYQQDPLKNEVTHADFLAVDMKQEIEAQVRVELVGEAEGAKQGGVLQQILYELSVTATPKNIPEVFEVDITDQQIGDTLTVGDIKDKYNITINHEDIEAIVTVQPPREEVEESDDSATQTEPEVIGEDKSAEA